VRSVVLLCDTFITNTETTEHTASFIAVLV